MKTTKTKNLLLGIAIGIGTSFATVAQNVPSYVPTNGLVGWWPFNGNANDESGNNNNGTVNGATLTSDRFGNANKAYSFDGINDYINGNGVNFPMNNNSRSISLWYKTTSVGLSRCSFEYGLTTNCYDVVILGMTNSGQPWSANSCGYFNGNNLVNDNLWHQIIVTYDGLGSNNMFVDGNLVATSSYNYNTQSIIYNIGRLTSQTQFGEWMYWLGDIDDIGIWNRALTQQEVTNLYSSVNCNNNLAITPQINILQIGNTATFNATTSDTNPNYVWQSDFGQGFQTLNNYGNYSGVNTLTLNIANVQLANHSQPIRAISNSGNCVDTSNVAYINIADTCITTVYDTITTYVSVTDTLFINVNTVGLNNNTIINTIKVFPNPANSHLNLDFGNFNSLNGYSIKIYNSLSQVIYNQQITQQSETIDLSTFGGNGVYFLHVINAQNNTVEIRKIVLQ